MIDALFGADGDRFINAKGVCEFQPRVTPWDARIGENRKTPKVLARRRIEYSFLLTLSGLNHRHPRFAHPGCYPVPELTNAFGVSNDTA